ncbi:SGNH/GDSL hydrolase family protein [Leptothoe kymatousa]|uniref:SGNH/GDSL hydrolase family protein n=1 Tax=Leptothoe kymatousa TAU-MAC 1615 TaxID=2364775 RepID=A0ABS5Y0N8_9CYAN|nr:SGNH/GDSL hydrolase family protein [Leptothoe kymatousa]MBT9311009.1 SGNH/GDSL hydrolase family protein [Leptothoe kymatousa TAU-MAC 1615]
MKKTLFAISLAISSCLVSLEARAASFTALNIFGDSLVDSGNLFNLTSALSPLGLPALPPSPPYAQKSSNGPIWIDNVGQALGLSPILATDLALNPTAPVPTQGINFAFTGALSSDIHILDDDVPPLASFLPGFQDQIAAFSGLSSIVPADPNALYVVWVGGNDYNEAFFNPASLQVPTLDQLPDFVTDNILGGLNQLASLGAKEFLVLNLPDIGEAPVADFLDAQTPVNIPATLNQLIAGHNSLLATKLDAFSQTQPGVNVTTLDINTLFDDLLTTPSAFGLTNVTDSCLINYEPGFQFDGVCDNPDEFLFWDDVHPTAAASRVISDVALATLAPPAGQPASVPEPGSFMALFAMGVMGSGSLFLNKKRI